MYIYVPTWCLPTSLYDIVRHFLGNLWVVFLRITFGLDTKIQRRVSILKFKDRYIIWITLQVFYVFFPFMINSFQTALRERERERTVGDKTASGREMEVMKEQLDSLSLLGEF